MAWVICTRGEESDSQPNGQPSMTAPTSSPTISPYPTPSSTTKTNILSVALAMAYVNRCILFGIIFCECVFDDDLCENENELKCKYKFKNVNADFNFYDYGDLCNGLLYPPPTITSKNNPTPVLSHPIIGDISEYVFNVVCNGIGFDCDVNNEMINNGV